MEQAPVFSKGRDLDAALEALRPWLAARLEVARVEIDPPGYPKGAGASNETLLIRAHAGGRTEDYAVRISPGPEHQMYYEPRFRLQYDILHALFGSSEVRVPEPLWFESDPMILGRPFYVMRRMRGRVPVSMPVYNASGWLFEATVAQRRTLWEDSMRQLAAIHRVPVAQVAFVDRPEHGASGDEQQLSYWHAYADWAFGEKTPEVAVALFEWLEAHRPRTCAPGLSWGDARIGNIMYDNDFRVLGVMDWEQVSLAGPVADLAWWLLFDESLSAGQGIPRLEGLGTREETIALWAESTGRATDELHWHEVFARLKVGLLSLHSRRSLPPMAATSTRHFSYLHHACELADLVVPEVIR
ncbi:phosphotransferase family protein [Nocardia macrotermitis]|uniref:Putative aminoglycoside phosphotransferase n=1 Tax=Nocardia macrotermitis TaxID=2585198 RepID=A0A7K0DF32_9NOCA|nr:phosphotransferase family protein [Nocardia macrotermitis]MQY24141.1 putative aminoglycoside phosphotransferase [Nocardia macrotermitis]